MTLLSRPLPARPLPLSTAVARSAGAANATLVARRDVGRSAALFALWLDAPLVAYQSGQYVAVGLPVAGDLVQRPYSIVSASAEGRRIELFVRLVPGGALSPSLLRRDQGARLRVGPPRGMFTLEIGDRRPRLLVGAGTGVAPLLAMLEDSTVRADGVPATLVHGVSHADELVFDNRLVAWRERGLALDYRPTVSRPLEPRSEGWSGRCGRAEVQLAAVVSEHDFEPDNVVAYLCGSPAMVEQASFVLADAGVPRSAIRVERF